MKPDKQPPPESVQDYLVSDPGEDSQLLRDRFQEWGYLYFPGLVPAQDCSGLLEDILHCTAPHVSPDSGTGRPELRGAPFFETDPTWDAVYPRVQALESFHRFFHCGNILAQMQVLVGPDVFVYPMKMARISTPGKIGHETPPHQDAHSHQAGPTMAGAWVALHDVDESMGRLRILPHSHAHGVRPVNQSEGVGGVQCEIYPEETTWHASNVGAGDVILFHSRTIHKAEPNTAERAARISVDTRFCDYGAPVFCTNIEPHHGWRIDELDWDYIYRDWQEEDLQFYWKDYPGLYYEL